MRPNSLHAFLARATLWLPLCLGLWYWKAEWFNGPAVLVSGWIVQGLFPGWVESVEWSQRTFSVLTSLELAGISVPARSGQVAVVAAQTNPLLFGFGLPLFATLLLAGREREPWHKLVYGALALVPLQAWGICFDILRQVVITAGPAARAQAGFSAWQIEAIVVAYQLGYLILPTVGPIFLWLAFNRQLIPALILEGRVQGAEHPGKSL